MSKDFFRSWQTLVFTISLVVLFSSYYFEFIQGLQPCPLCLMQRFCVIALLLTSVIGIFLKSRRAGHVILGLQLFFALAGVYFAARQLWLQSLPADQLPACLPGLDVLMKYFPWQDILHALFFGAADCGEVNWQWLGLPMPGWAAIYFGGIFFTSIIVSLMIRHSAVPD